MKLKHFGQKGSACCEMSHPIYDLNNSQNWQFAYSEQKTAQQTHNGYYFPIPEFQLPTLFESPVLLVEVDCPEAKPWWWLGGTARLSIDGPGVVADEVFLIRRRLPVNRPAIIQFPQVLPQYNLSVSIVPWLRQVTLSVYEFVGPIADSTEQLLIERTDVLRVDLARIEAKLNAMN